MTVSFKKKKNTPIEGLARGIKQSGVSVLALVSRVTHSCGAMPAHVKSQYQNADETENSSSQMAIIKAAKNKQTNSELRGLNDGLLL